MSVLQNNEWNQLQGVLMRLNNQIEWALERRDRREFSRASSARNGVLERLSRLAQAEIDVLETA